MHRSSIYLRVYARARVCARVCAHVCARVCARVQVCVQICMCTYACACIRVRVCISTADCPRLKIDSSIGMGPFPDGGVLWRGGRFLEKHRGFFTKGKIFRAPNYLATSFKRHTAEYFRLNAINAFRAMPVGIVSQWVGEWVSE